MKLLNKMSREYSYKILIWFINRSVLKLNITINILLWNIAYK